MADDLIKVKKTTEEYELRKATLFQMKVRTLLLGIIRQQVY